MCLRVCVRARVCVLHVSIHVHIHADVWRPEVMYLYVLSIFLFVWCVLSCLVLVLKTVSLIERQSSLHSVTLPGEPLGPSHPCLPSAGITAVCCCTRIFMSMLKIQTQVLVPVQQAFCKLM